MNKTVKVQRKSTSPGACRQFTLRAGGPLLLQKGGSVDLAEELATALVEDYPEHVELVSGKHKPADAVATAATPEETEGA